MSEKHTGLIEDSRFPCGYKFDEIVCANMSICTTSGIFGSCKSIRGMKK